MNKSILILSLIFSFQCASAAKGPEFTFADMKAMAEETVKAVSGCKDLKVMPVMEVGNFKNATDESIDKKQYVRLVNAGLKKVRPGTKLGKGEKAPVPSKLWAELSSEKVTEGPTTTATYKLKFNTLEGESFCGGEYEIKKDFTAAE